MDSSSHYIVTDSPKMTHQQGQLIMPSSFEQRSLGKKKGEKFQNTSGTKSFHRGIINSLC